MLNEEQREYIRRAYHLYVDTFGQFFLSSLNEDT